jgi:hypothetical protein
VLGIDDFALPRGHVYATILIDISIGRSVDVLPDRAKDTVAACLHAHPGVQIVCRDRVWHLRRGRSRGRARRDPVADRWQLWHNLGEAVEKAVIANRADLAEPAPQPAPDTHEPAPGPRPSTGPATRDRVGQPHPGALRRHTGPAAPRCVAGRHLPSTASRPAHRAPLPRGDDGR